MKKKVLSIMLTLAILISFMPLATMNTHAASTGTTTLLKTKTVSIKPGKTYKTPKFSLSGDMAVVMSVESWLSPKDKNQKAFIKKGGYTATLKTAKGKSEGKVKGSLKGIRERDGWWHNAWYYWYDDDGGFSNPGLNKGKYYFAIKNTTSRIIKFKYSVKGYTEFASNADFPTDVTLDGGWVTVGKIGPGIPLIEKISISDPDLWFEWSCPANGVLEMAVDTEFVGQKTATLEVKLKNRDEPYKVKLTIIGSEEEDEYDEDYDDDYDEE